MHNSERKNRMNKHVDTCKSTVRIARRPAAPAGVVRLGGYYFYFRGDIRRGG
jgi:hypothetical protein